MTTDYGKTIRLPKTEFPRRAGLGKLEPQILARWEKMDLYARQRAESKGREKFILHFGPPFANGHIHVGHFLTHSLKDIVCRNRQMMGFDAPLVPGYDCHGLPIEWKIEEKYRAADKNFKKDSVDPATFRAECRAYAAHWSDIQSTELARAGILADWKNPYSTMHKKSEALIAGEIHKFLLSGDLTRGSKPVMWSIPEQTALAEAEVEYKDVTSDTAYVKFPINKEKSKNLPKELEGASIVIWTTTPWTLPANRAIAYGEEIEYVGIEVKWTVGDTLDINSQVLLLNQKIVIAESLYSAFKKETKIGTAEDNGAPETFWRGKGKDLAGIVCHHPLAAFPSPPAQRVGEGQGEGGGNTNANLADSASASPPPHPNPLPPLATLVGERGHTAQDYNFDVPLLAGDFVTTDVGTGFVHIAPGHGEDDYRIIIEHNKKNPNNTIEIPETVGPDGKYFAHVPMFAGAAVYWPDGKKGTANKLVTQAIADAGNLAAKGQIQHSYPHSWRSKAPVIFRNTPQWFISMDKNGLRAKAMTQIKKTRWIPANGENRISAMVEQRGDWNVSRQRSWGVPLAFFVNKKTNEPLRDEKVLKRTIDIFHQEGADAWFTRPATDFLGSDYKSEDYEQVRDIIDVWFESGSTQGFVLEERPELQRPADLYLEGSDQHRGWFQSSLLVGCGTRGDAPFKNVLTHGFLLDEKGFKQSKSQGNVTDPMKLMELHGADVLRLWVAGSDFTEDIRFGENILQGHAEVYRRLRGTFCYLLGSIDNSERVAYKDLADLDKYILHCLHAVDAEARQAAENFDFQHILHTLHNFCTRELSAFYFDICKDTLYCDAQDSVKRRAVVTVLDHVFNVLVHWLAPFIPFTAEEAWLSYKGLKIDDGGEESIHLSSLPSPKPEWENLVIADSFAVVISARAAVTAALEPRRAAKEIGASLEAAPLVQVDAVSARILKSVPFSDICITSGMEIIEGNESSVEVIFKKAEGEKCVRCWKYTTDVGKDSNHPTCCTRCASVVRDQAGA